MLPLKGVKVLDLTSVLGFATMELADYGADVLKVERPKVGDGVRSYPPFKEGVSLYQVFMDRGKKSISLNTRSEEGKAILKELVKDADVLVENFKVGTMEKLGLSYDVLKEINPKLVYAELTAYGSTGPCKDWIGFDITIQAKSGVMDITGMPDGAPTRVGAYLGDHYSCTYLCSAIMMALYHARATGVGQKVEVSMFEALFSATEDRVAIYDFSNKNTTRSGNSHPAINPYDLLPCKDGYYGLGVSTDAQWIRFCEAFGVAEWGNDPKYCENKARGAHYFGDLRDKLVDLMSNYTKAEMDERCCAARVPGAPCNSIEETMEMDQLKERQMLVDIEDERIGKLNTVGKIIKFHDSDPALPTKGAPALGQNNDEVYGSMFSKEKIEQLEQDDVI